MSAAGVFSGCRGPQCGARLHRGDEYRRAANAVARDARTGAAGGADQRPHLPRPGSWAAGEATRWIETRSEKAARRDFGQEHTPYAASEGRIGHRPRTSRQGSGSHGHVGWILLAGARLRKPFDHRAEDHRHELERTALLWPARRRAGAVSSSGPGAGGVKATAARWG